VEHYLHLGLHGKDNWTLALPGTGRWYWPDVLLVVCCSRWWWYKRYTSARVYIVLKAAIPLVLLSDGMNRCSARISTKQCMILCIRTVLAFAHLCSRDSHFKLEIIDLTAPGSRLESCSKQMYLPKSFRIFFLYRCEI
jgi:hypothetical protein